ncbi:MAG: hypothetical protein ACXW3L_00340 [Limisphaerales bacterium]
MKQITALKLTCVGAVVATLGMGCASTGYARYDADQTDMDQGVGVSASADVGTDNSAIRTEADLSKDSSATVRTDLDRSDKVAMNYNDNDTLVVADTEGEERVTVSALSFSPDTRATWVNKFPFDRRIRTIDTYTFAVPGSNADLSTRRSDAPQFRTELPSGSVFVEAAGGAGEVRTGGRVIQHSPSPTR